MAEIPQNSFQGPLAPKIGLNDTVQSPIPGGGAKIPKKRNFTGLIPVGALAIALLILPLTIQQINQQQSTKQQASQPTPSIVLPTQTTNHISITPGVKQATPPVSPPASPSARPSFTPRH